jgi:hypothetical protein
MPPASGIPDEQKQTDNIPIVSPIAACIAKMQTNQMKTG